MLLTEIMNRTLPVEEVNVDDDEAIYRFELPDGRIYLIEYDKLSDDPEVWEAGFRDSEDSSTNQYELTNKGSEIQILMTCFQNVGQFLQAHPDSVVFFTADTPKRASVYDKLTKRIAPYYQVDKSPEGKAQFYLGKPENVQEYMQTMAELNTRR